MPREIDDAWIEDAIPYDGSQLRSHFAYRALGLVGESIVAWCGPCDVALDALVDLEDQREGGTIHSASMLHFVVEHFEGSLARAVVRQRLLVVIAADVIESLGVPRPMRRGDDLFHDDRKLSVSIATASPVSTLVHLGLNVDAKGAPVPAADLGELGLEARRVAEAVQVRYAEECASIEHARRKVRAVP